MRSSAASAAVAILVCPPSLSTSTRKSTILATSTCSRTPPLRMASSPLSLTSSRECSGHRGPPSTPRASRTSRLRSESYRGQDLGHPPQPLRVEAESLRRVGQPQVFCRPAEDETRPCRVSEQNPLTQR